MSIKQIYATYDWKNNPEAGNYKYCPYCSNQLVMKEIALRHRPVCPDCGFIHFKNPVPAVVVLLVQGEKVLLGKRACEPGMGLWGLTSGYIEYDDDFIDAAEREVKEETNLDVEIRSIVNVESAFLTPKAHFLTVYLLARVVGGDLDAGDDVEAVDWFPLSVPLPPMAFQPDVDLIQAYSEAELKCLPIG